MNLPMQTPCSSSRYRRPLTTTAQLQATGMAVDADPGDACGGGRHTALQHYSIDTDFPDIRSTFEATIMLTLKTSVCCLPSASVS